jgi:hypothetical protein
MSSFIKFAIERVVMEGLKELDYKYAFVHDNALDEHISIT